MIQFLKKRAAPPVYRCLNGLVDRFDPRRGAILRHLLAETEWFLISRSRRNRWRKAEYATSWGRARWDLGQRWGTLPCAPKESDRLAALRDRYRGERIFLIGNGPSLNRTPMHRLKNEYTFGVNRIYLMFDRIDWRPTFYTINDGWVGPDNAEEINSLDGMTFFLPQNFKGLMTPRDRTYWYWTRPPGIGEPFAEDITGGIVTGQTVMVIAIQIASYLGFDPIYLIGVDASYTVPETVRQSGEVFRNGVRLYLESTRDDDHNHFSPVYFGRGKKWQYPHVPGMIAGFARCREAARSRGRKIFNATVGGRLEVFPRVDFDSLF